MDFGDGDWKPPTEEEMREIEKRRNRSNKISKIMGEYLLKGYRMLDKNCPICSTVYLQTPKSDGGVNYCVSCVDIAAGITTVVIVEHWYIN